MNTNWHYENLGAEAGPITFDQLLYIILSQQIPFNSRVWNPTMLDWVPANQVPLIKQYLENQVAPPPGQGQLPQVTTTPITGPAYQPTYHQAQGNIPHPTATTRFTPIAGPAYQPYPTTSLQQTSAPHTAVIQDSDSVETAKVTPPQNTTADKFASPPLTKQTQRSKLGESTENIPADRIKRIAAFITDNLITSTLFFILLRVTKPEILFASYRSTDTQAITLAILTATISYRILHFIIHGFTIYFGGKSIGRGLFNLNFISNKNTGIANIIHVFLIRHLFADLALATGFTLLARATASQ